MQRNIVFFTVSIGDLLLQWFFKVWSTFRLVVARPLGMRTHRSSHYADSLLLLMTIGKLGDVIRAECSVWRCCDALFSIRTDQGLSAEVHEQHLYICVLVISGSEGQLEGEGFGIICGALCKLQWIQCSRQQKYVSLGEYLVTGRRCGLPCHHIVLSVKLSIEAVHCRWKRSWCCSNGLLLRHIRWVGPPQPSIRLQRSWKHSHNQCTITDAVRSSNLVEFQLPWRNAFQCFQSRPEEQSLILQARTVF